MPDPWQAVGKREGCWNMVICSSARFPDNHYIIESSKQQQQNEESKYKLSSSSFSNSQEGVPSPSMCAAEYQQQQTSTSNFPSSIKLCAESKSSFKQQQQQQYSSFKQQQISFTNKNEQTNKKSKNNKPKRQNSFIFNIKYKTESSFVPSFINSSSGEIVGSPEFFTSPKVLEANPFRSRFNFNILSPSFCNFKNFL